MNSVDETEALGKGRGLTVPRSVVLARYTAVRYGSLIFLILLFLGFAAATPLFLSPSNLTNVALPTASTEACVFNYCLLAVHFWVRVPYNGRELLPWRRRQDGPTLWPSPRGFRWS